MINPYWGKSFVGFVLTFFHRIYLFCTGQLGGDSAPLASDELQIFVLAAIGISCALIGVFLVLKKMTMLANSISHTILVGIVIAFLILEWFAVRQDSQLLFIDLKVLLLASLITSLLTMALTDLLHRFMKLQEDASIGLIFTMLFALGIILVTSFTRNSHIGTEVIMGNVDMLHPHDLKLALYLLGGNLAILLLFYKEFLITTFDPTLARLSGISHLLFTYLLLVQTSATAIIAFRAVGVILVLSLLVAPVLTARLCTKRMRPLLLLSALFSCLASFIAVGVARHMLSIYGMALSTAGLIALTHALLYVTVLIIVQVKKALAPSILSKEEQIAILDL